ncbi:aminopeptidase [Cryptotrichosporon argae]
MPCRSRKCKCGGDPPGPCPNCLADDYPCSWPTEDGRSSEARRERSRKQRLASLATRGLGRPEPRKQRTDDDVKDDVWGTPDTRHAHFADLYDPGQHSSTPGFPSSAPSGPAYIRPGLVRAASQYPRPHAHVPAFPQHMVDPHNYGHALPDPHADAIYQGASPTDGLFHLLGDPHGPPMAASPHIGDPYAALAASDRLDHDAVFDPAQFILSMSTQLPTVEVASTGTAEDRSPGARAPGVATSSSHASRPRRESKIVKVTWWRPHGPTAIAPGLKRLTLKVHVDGERLAPAPGSTVIASTSAIGSAMGSTAGAGSIGGADDLFDASGMPVAPVMRHLLDVFAVRFECQFPFLSAAALAQDLATDSASVFLFNAVAALAARFSTHPAIALPDLQPHAYGNVFAARAHGLLAPMLGLPSRETVVALVLLAHVGFANDNESQEWMYTGMAVRMAVDLGLHLDPGPESDIAEDERRLNRLVFWSTLVLDFALSFGVGRQTTFRPEEITQLLPTDEDIQVRAAGHVDVADPDPTSTSPRTAMARSMAEAGPRRSPFPHAARMMVSYGRLINLLNGQHDEESEREAMAARETAIREYSRLPEDMVWNVQNLQRHAKANQAPIYVHIHLWMHTVIASAYLTSAELPRRSSQRPHPTSGYTTPGGATANFWRNSVRTIGDVLVLSDVIDPHAYLALPFVNQAFYVAGCCLIKEIEQHREHAPAEPDGADATSANDRCEDETARTRGKQIELFRSLLMSAATTSMSTLQSGLAKQTTYWSGVAWVAGTLAQRIGGIKARDVDLERVQEELKSVVWMPDAGVVRGRGRFERVRESAERTPAGSAWGDFDIGAFDFLPLPFDLTALDGGVDIPAFVARPVVPRAPAAAPARTYSSSPHPAKPPRSAQPLARTHAHLVAPGELTPGVPAEEYEARRRALMDRLGALGEGATVVCMGGTVRLVSQQIFYRFRQATDFFYLTGLNEPDATLVLEARPSSARGYKYTLFVPPRDAHETLWVGEKCGVEGAVDVFGADEAYPNTELASRLPKYLSSGPIYASLPPSPSPSPSSQPLHPPTPRRRSSLLKLFSPSASASAADAFSSADPPHLVLAAALASAHAAPLESHAQALRAVKSRTELGLMKAAADVSAAAHAVVMRHARAGMPERELEGLFEWECARKGSERPAYVPVVASGANALVIHYTHNDCVLDSDDLILIDAGCERHMYASDITRTFPVSGTFSPAQRDLYQAVLSVQKACVRECTDTGVSLNELHRTSCSLLAQELKQIGFKLSIGDIERKLYPHFLSHHLGSDLHDCPTTDRNQHLVPGNVVTIEPGIYVPFDAAFPKAFHGLGVRIEDEVAVTPDGPLVLSANAPKEIVDVEAACQGMLEARG